VVNPARLPALFWLLALTNLFVGGMVGLERTLVPLLATDVFHLAAGGAALAFIASFGIAKAFGNLAVGALADRYGRLAVLRAGWLLAWPVPLVLLLAQSWTAVILVNVLLGVQQALTWSMTINMMIDAAGPARRGLATGLNELAGYLGVSVVAFVTGLLAAPLGLRTPLALGFAIALIGTVLAFRAQETGRAAPRPSGLGQVFRLVSWQGPALSSAALLGFATNFKDGAVWGLLPLVLVARGFELPQVAAVAGTYTLVWALSQALFGPLSDRVGRRFLGCGGVLLQTAALWALSVSASLPSAFLAAALLGTGTGMAYPTLMAWVADESGADWRATALGVYRFWRDAGYAAGALSAGGIAAALGAGAALSWTAIGVGVLALVAWWRSARGAVVGRA
jgi:MFS family permease